MKQLLNFYRKYRWFIIGGVIIAAMLYSIINRAANQKSRTLPESSPTPSLAVSPSPSPVAITTPTPTPTITAETLTFPSLDSQSKILYYYQIKSATFRTRDLTTGRETAISSVINLVRQAVWSPNHQLILLAIDNALSTTEIPNPYHDSRLPENSVIVGLYDLKQKRFIRLNDGILSFNFISNDRIIYQYVDENDNNLSISELDGSRWKNIQKLTGDIELSSAGETSLVQEINSNKVIRYNRDGKSIETLTVPNDLRLSRSVFAEQGQSAIYWVSEGGQVIIKRLRGDKTETLTTLPKKPDELSILWDNNNGDIYIADFDGLHKLNVISKP